MLNFTRVCAPIAFLLALLLNACSAGSSVTSASTSQPTMTEVNAKPVASTSTPAPAIGWQETPLPHLLESISLRNVNSIEEVARWNAPVWSEYAILEIAYSPDGARFAVVAPDGVYLYDTQTLELINLYQPAYHVIFSPDSASLAMAMKKGREVALWSLDENREIRSFSRTDIAQNNEMSYVTGLTFSTDGKILSVSFVDAVKLWNVKDGREIHALKQNFACGGGDGCAALIGAERTIFSPDGKTLLVLNAADREIQWWDVGEWKLLNTLPVELSGRDTQPLFAVDSTGARFAISSLGVSLYDMQTLEKIMYIGPIGMSSAFSPDGKIFAFGYQDRWQARDTMEFFDAINGGKLYTLNMPAAVDNIAFSPDGKILATTLNDGTIRLWGVKP